MCNMNTNRNKIMRGSVITVWRMNKQIPCIMAGKKYLINKETLTEYLRGTKA